MNLLHMKHFFFSLLLVWILAACNGQPSEAQLIEIQTPYGVMKVKLYDQTPLHRDNFIKLTQQGYFDSLLFHRVIAGFMIQGGDPKSKNAPSGAPLGESDPGYTLPSEIHFPKYFHKKGALAAARTSDQINPERKSSGSQFYIVQGKPLTGEELTAMEDRINHAEKQKLFYKILPQFNDSLNYYQKTGNTEKLSKLQTRIIEDVEVQFARQTPFHYPDSIREIYQTQGGTPMLDGQYTVFGEVVEGLQVIDSIAAAATDARNRPVKDIKMVLSFKK